jgi:putative hemolysin
MGITQATLVAGFAYFIMTALHVIIGELMPKSIALQRTEKTALQIGRPMAFFAMVFSPLIWLLNGVGNFLLRLLGFHAAEGHSQVHSPEELDMIFTESHKGGRSTRPSSRSCTASSAFLIPRRLPSWCRAWKCKPCLSP